MAASFLFPACPADIRAKFNGSFCIPPDEPVFPQQLDKPHEARVERRGLLPEPRFQQRADLPDRRAPSIWSHTKLPCWSRSILLAAGRPKHRCATRLKNPRCAAVSVTSPGSRSRQGSPGSRSGMNSR